MNIIFKRINEINIRLLLSRWENLYGAFDKTDYDDFNITIQNESGYLHGEFIAWTKSLSPLASRILLAGEENNIKSVFQWALSNKNVITAGLQNVDYVWNFENDPPPNMGKFNLIMSQAILEHLLNPYKHLRDFIQSISNGGVFNRTYRMSRISVSPVPNRYLAILPRLV